MENNLLDFQEVHELFKNGEFTKAFTKAQELIKSKESQQNKTVLALLYDFLGQCTKKKAMF